MIANGPRLRGSGGYYSGPWLIGEIPDRVLLKIGEQIVHRLAIGHADITGDDFGTIFANAVDGIHRESPLGVADVIANGTAWSVKTIKHKPPAGSPVYALSQAAILLISHLGFPIHARIQKTLAMQYCQFGTSASMNLWVIMTNCG